MLRDATPPKKTRATAIGPSRFYQWLHLVALLVFAVSTTVALVRIITAPVFDTSSATAAIVGPLLGAFAGVSLWFANASRVAMTLAEGKKTLHVAGPGGRRRSLVLWPSCRLVVSETPTKGAFGVAWTQRSLWLTSEGGPRQLVADRVPRSRDDLERLIAPLNERIAATMSTGHHETNVAERRAPVSGLHVRVELRRTAER